MKTSSWSRELTDLEKGIERAESRRKAAEERERRKEMEEELSYKEQNRLNYGKKLKLARQIFSWIKTFMSTKEYAKVISIHRRLYGKDAITLYRSERLGDSPPPEDDVVPSSYVQLEADGTLSYYIASRGYRVREGTFEMSEELAEFLDLDYLKEFNRSIRTLKERVLAEFKDHIKANTADSKGNQKVRKRAATA